MALMGLLPDQVLGEDFTLVRGPSRHLQRFVVLALRPRLRLSFRSMQKPIEEPHVWRIRPSSTIDDKRRGDRPPRLRSPVLLVSFAGGYGDSK